MGNSCVTQCANCEDHKDYQFGVGMMFSSLPNIIELFPLGVQKKIIDLESKYTFEATDYSFELFECSHCDTSHSRLSLKIQYDNGKTYEPNYRCYECKRKLKLSNRDIESFKCRKCGSYSLKELPNSLMWD